VSASDDRSPAASGVAMVAVSATVNAASRYLHWGVIQISLTNLLIIVVMIVVFVLALVIPFPRDRADASEERSDDGD
jgi:hypothetical protein